MANRDDLTRQLRTALSARPGQTLTELVTTCETSESAVLERLRASPEMFFVGPPGESWYVAKPEPRRMPDDEVRARAREAARLTAKHVMRETPSSKRVHITRFGPLFHGSPDCPVMRSEGGRRRAYEHEVESVTSSDAGRRGKSPCPRCFP